MRRGWVWLLVVLLPLAFAPVAEAISSSGGGSRSSSSSGSSRSSGGGGGGGSYKSSGGGGGGGSIKSVKPSTPGVSKPSAARPSSGPKQQVNSSHLIPKSMRGVRVPPGRNFSRDTTRLRSNRSYTDPYSPRYYGHTSSPFYYLWLASVLDDDGNDPIPPQQCRRYDESEHICLDYYNVQRSNNNGGDCSGGFLLWPWMLGGGGFMALRRRMRGAA